MHILLLISALAHATPSFDPTRADATFEDRETYTIDGEIKIWSRIERLSDPDRTLLTAEEFNTGIEWPTGAPYAPWIREAFGTAQPGTHLALLHFGPRFPAVAGTPILFVPGAGDNASRGFVTMATRMDNRGRPVFALTFAHPHGDVLRQAELVADAIARIKEVTGATQVDVVSHSKGGLATAAYLSNHAGARWGRADYESVGTRYRGDVRKAVFVATPLGGIDTTFRWPSGNYSALDADLAVSPTSWDTYYPSGVGVPWVNTDLRTQDFLPGDGDLFPGHRQLLRRWDGVYPLPGSDPTLGSYAIQQDWYTTYEGGTGYFSHAAGIDAVIEESGDLLGYLESNGVDPEVELYLLAGSNPLMPNASEDYLARLYGDALVDLAFGSAELWAAFIADLADRTAAGFLVSESELQGLVSGALLFGEISGPSDGLVFIDSALMADTLTGRGAVVVATETKDLSHLDLLYASPITGGLLQDAAADDPTANGWMEGVGARYIAEDSLGWVETALADEASGGDGGGGDAGADGSGTDGADGGSSGGQDGADGTGGTDGSVNTADDAGGNATGTNGETEDGKDPGSCSTAGGSLHLLALIAGGFFALCRRRPV